MPSFPSGPPNPIAAVPRNSAVFKAAFKIPENSLNCLEMSGGIIRSSCSLIPSYTL